MMTTIFVCSTREDAACAEAINQQLETKGYRVWREPTSLSIESVLSPRTIENVILGSAAVILLWSNHTVQSEWVERYRLFAQGLKKLIVPVVLDGTELPNTLVAITSIAAQLPCTDVIAQLAPSLPAPDSQDALLLLYEQAAHDFIRVRKEIIEQAAIMLRQGEHREEVLAVLEYLARHDLMMGVREKAQEVLEADARQEAAPPPLLRPGDSRYIFGVRCSKGHVTYFDKRRVCFEKELLVHRRVQRAGTELDELELTCKVCGEVMMVRIKCEDES